MFGAMRRTSPQKSSTIAASPSSAHSEDDGRFRTSLEEMFGIGLDFDALYTLSKRLRSGSFATVYICKHELSKDEFAVKVIDRTKLKPKDDEGVYREVHVLKSLQGYPGVINLIDFFEKPKVFHVILELARGGDVFDRLGRRTVYTEADARRLSKCLLESMAYIHSRYVTHRDIKPENLLLMEENDDSLIKIADFGFARQFEPGEPKLVTRCGTPAFVAPEILVGAKYNHKGDMWSIGVCLYLLLGGYPPFQADNHKDLFRKIRAGDYVFHESYWDSVSIEAKQLISSLLQVDPVNRLEAHQALRMPWMLLGEDNLSDRSLDSTIAEIKRFNAKRKLKGAVSAVRWAVSASFWNADTISFSTASSNIPGQSSRLTQTNQQNATARITNVKAGITFKDVYELEKQIRSGTFATVWAGRHVTTGVQYAIKVVKRKDLKPKDDAAVLNEVAILKSLKEEHIVALHDFYEEKDNFYLVMEYMSGGDVFDRIVQRSHYTEKDARDLIRNVLKAVQFIHDHGCAHRDLKPQNLLLQTAEDDATIKVADFGFAKRVHTPQSLITRCGTPTYVAPEILKNHPHDESVDMWSVGVIMYVLLVGYPPFMEENQKVLFRKIRMGTYEFYEEDWSDISSSAKELIQSLLVVDPIHRMTVGEALRHPWILHEDDEMLSRNSLMGSLGEIRKYMEIAQVSDDPNAMNWVAENHGVFT